MEAIWLIAWTGMAAAGPIGMAGAIGATRIWLGPGVDALASIQAVDSEDDEAPTVDGGAGI